jgi:hypothetical protein
MTEGHQDVHETLAQLCQQLEAAEQIDPRIAERLRHTLGELQSALARGDATAAGHASLADHLTESAVHFEQSHPTLAGTVRRLIDVLGQMGI